MMSSASSPPFLITMGEPAGIGGEILLKAWGRLRKSGPVFAAVDNPSRLTGLAKLIGQDTPLREIGRPEEAASVFSAALPVIPVDLPRPPVPGTIDPENASAVRDSIEQAVALTLSGEAAAVVTNPIHKLAQYRDGFEFPGHTEFLAHLAGAGTEPVMMLASERLRVVPVTRHVSLKEALARLDEDLVAETISITAKALATDFGIEHPRIAVAGLNPHAGEGGTMGREEIELLKPVIDRCGRAGLRVLGPLSPDTMFHDAARGTYDAAVCMYHDQALIPIKTLDFDRAVNVTLGLPFIRTSPDHGTALDLAGTGTARETSLVSAIETAAAIAENRQKAPALA